MNNIEHGNIDDFKAFQLLSEVADENPVSQRELAKRLGIALGLVNSYIKNFVSKGFIRVKNYPQNRYAYLLTPTGISEKARLAYQHVNYFTNLYTVTRQDYRTLFLRLSATGATTVTFCGVDEVAEIAWLSLQETGIKLDDVMDDTCIGQTFMGMTITGLPHALLSGKRWVVLTSLKRAVPLKARLLEMGVSEELILSPYIVINNLIENGEER